MNGTRATAALRVTGMTCSNCVRHVRQAAERVPGVSDVEVDLAGGRATVTFDPAVTTPVAIAAAITEAGYESSEAGPAR